MQNLVISDHYLPTFQFLLITYKPRATSYYSRCLSEDTVENFKEMIPSALISVSYPKITEDSDLRFIPSQLDHLPDFTACSLRASLDSIAPVKKKTKPGPGSRLLETLSFSK